MTGITMQQIAQSNKYLKPYINILLNEKNVMEF